MSDDTVVYLAGPVAAYHDGGAAWRDMLIEGYDEYEFRNPLDKYNVPLEELEIVPRASRDGVDKTVGVRELVENDKRLIDESDGILLGYTAVRSIGTPMEVMYAREREMPVAIWIRDDIEMEDLSPWYRYHATAITTAAGMGMTHIENQAGESPRGVGEVL